MAWPNTHPSLKYRQNFPELRLKSFLLRKTDIINQFYHFWLLSCSLCAGFFGVALLWLQRLFKIFAMEFSLDKKEEKIICYNFLNYCIIDILSPFFGSNILLASSTLLHDFALETTSTNQKSRWLMRHKFWRVF